MAVTATQIRNLLNNPRGLIQGTITEYITIRTNQVTKVARGSNYAVATANVVTDDLKDDAIKMSLLFLCKLFVPSAASLCAFTVVSFPTFSSSLLLSSSYPSSRDCLNE